MKNLILSAALVLFCIANSFASSSIESEKVTITYEDLTFSKAKGLKESLLVNIGKEGWMQRNDTQKIKMRNETEIATLSIIELDNGLYSVELNAPSEIVGKVNPVSRQYGRK
ncbi:hypothetical protein [Aureibacter tunicatorum]|uniref:Secreted protein n=1 Tax=Aureibacter tunicatorum TaxID=866807 RepID=A0AAE4BTU1_9BACT|nr:hypothetical protein [Aureibacter tunicatorum]MDR6240310.1 hypothetical protein [Aureibacter tunicatorum]BDD05809.1 hypothetical protein AUTU_32920 [Aureibacter tunicatorum]